MKLPIKVKASDLWRWDGGISRTKYVVLGTTLAILKYFLDCWVSQTFFHKTWSVLEYFAPGYARTPGGEPLSLGFYLTMLALSLPFAWTGSVLTIRRLRAAGLAPWMVIFFYFPVINLIFFKILSWMPSHDSEEEDDVLGMVSDTTAKTAAGIASDTTSNAKADDVLVKREESEANLDAVANRVDSEEYSLLYSFVGASLIPVIPATILVYLSTLVLGSYGYGLFVAVPFALSIISPLIYAVPKQRSMITCCMVSWANMVFIYMALILLGFEGVVCLIMAAPIVAVIAAGGGLLAYLIQRRRHRNLDLPKLSASFMVLLALLIFLEVKLEPHSPLYEVTTKVEVDAPPETVWKHVVAFTRLDKPEELIFKIGVAYPVEAKIYGTGKGAIRHCIFSTGKFVEPITTWDEPRLLQFSVKEQALPMKEFSPYEDIHPPHLDGYLMSRKGEFLLTRSKNGGTLLAGTTWYQNSMGPPLYWRMWSDQVIHTIHKRVLDHVKDLAENEKPVIGNADT